MARPRAAVEEVLVDDDEVDVIVVGAGVAGCVAAYRLAAAGRSVVLLERGATPGGKNLSGGVFYCRVMEQVFPGFVDAAPVERVVTRNQVLALTPDGSVGLDSRDASLAAPANAVTVLRAHLDAWLVERCEEVGVMVLPGVRADGLVREHGRVVGVEAGEDVLRARLVILADGVNSFLARSIGLRAPEPQERLAVGVKSVIRLGRERLEDRFGVRGRDGAAIAAMGDATLGIGGGGFCYTNTDSVSVGVVLRLDSLVASGLSSSDVHDHFLAHPAIAPYLEGGELLEYGCHLTIEDGPAMAREPIAAPGVLLVGDAAGFTLNTGLTIRGMDLAAGSAIAASTVAEHALAGDDLGLASEEAYRAELARGVVGADLETYRHAPAFLERDELYRDAGPLVAGILHDVFALDGTPRRRLVPTARRALRRSPLSIRRLAGLGLAAARSL
jgi:electron transfer flavoprotein-quinone oxidoreductase